MISIDVNSLNDRDLIADAIAKLTTVLTALEAEAERRAKVRGLLYRDDIAEYARKIIAENTRGPGLTPYQIVYRNALGEAFTKPDDEIVIVTRFSDLTPEDLDEMNAGPTVRSIEPYAPPFMDPQEAIQDDGIVCLIDGEKRKFLSRYVRQVHGLGWEEYLRRFDLPSDYPRTSKDVIAQRKELAIERGLGKTRAPEVEEQVQVTVPVHRTFGGRPAPQQVSVNIDIGGATVSAQTDRTLAAELGRKLRGLL